MKFQETNPVDVCCAIIKNKYEKVLIAQRSSAMSLPLKWEFPGGKVEQAETAEQCLIRELKEELNITVEIVRLVGSHIHKYPNLLIKLIAFECTIVSGEIVLAEHVDFKWVSIENLLGLDLADADVPFIDKL